MGHKFRSSFVSSVDLNLKSRVRCKTCSCSLETCPSSHAKPRKGKAGLTRTHDTLTRLITMRALSLFQACCLAATQATSSAERERAFERVYDEGRWVNGMDGALCSSGWSNVAAGQGTSALQAVLKVVDTLDIRSIADIPSGDGCFAGALLRELRNRTAAAQAVTPTIEYVGIDIVARLVARNNALYGDGSTEFLQADVVSGASPLPRADLIFSRQMLQHLCTEDALRFVRMVARSPARFALLTTFETNDAFVNSDIGCASGEYRPQDLTKPPFNLPTPIALFSEQYPTDPRVSLGLWPVRMLRHRLL